MAARILEITHDVRVKMALPDQTELINTEFATNTARRLIDRLRHGLKQVVRLCRLVFEPPYDIVFCRALSRFQYIRSYSFPINVVRWLMGMLVSMSVWLQVRRGAQLAVVDLRDELTIDWRDLTMLRLATCYFKRELPQNAWNVFLRVQPPYGGFSDLTMHPGFLPHIKKFSPASLGITTEKIQQIHAVPLPPDDEKTLDVFYAGHFFHSTVRQAGQRCLQELSHRGLRVECIEGYLPFEEFVNRMRRAWLVWSPEGQGWDCYRHYEVCVAGSVPLMNHASLRRHQPLLDRVHCIYYAVEGDDLCCQVERALADQVALRRMAAAVRTHVLAHHSDVQQGSYMARHMLNLWANPETKDKLRR